LFRFLDHTQLDAHAHKHTHTRQVSSHQPVTEVYTYTTHNTKQTNIQALSGILTRDPRNRATADLRLNHTATGIGFIYIYLNAFLINIPLLGKMKIFPSNEAAVE
jgi:hypothetical protein